MKKYAVIVTLIALGLLAYILFGQQANEPAPAPAVYSASVYQAPAASSPTASPTAYINFTKSVTNPPSYTVTKTYILNKNTKVFHLPSCKSVEQMKASNKRTYTGTRQDVINMGYRPCGNCHP